MAGQFRQCNWRETIRRIQTIVELLKNKYFDIGQAELLLRITEIVGTG
jgi:hypothetical protein